MKGTVSFAGTSCTAEMALPAFCDDWMPEVAVEEMQASVARMPTRGTRHRRARAGPLPYGARLVVSQRCAPLVSGGNRMRTYRWLFQRVRIVRVTTRYSWQRACHFRFLTAYGDHRGEELVSLLSDPNTGRCIWIGRETPGVGAAGVEPRFVDWRLPGSKSPAPRRGHDRIQGERMTPDVSVREADYGLYRAYQLARRTVEEKLRRGGRDEEAERDSRIQREMKRLDAYYTEMRSEVVEPLGRLYRQIAVAHVRRRLTHSEQTAHLLDQTIQERTDHVKKLEARCGEEIDWLEREWRLRRDELAALRELNVRVTLMSAAWAWLPRMAIDAELDGETTRTATLTWDVSVAWPVQAECEGCGRPTATYTLCKGGHLVCSTCAALCPECGRGLCASCTSRRCAACEALLCPDCGRKGGHFSLCSECAETPEIGSVDSLTMGVLE